MIEIRKNISRVISDIAHCRHIIYKLFYYQRFIIITNHPILLSRIIIMNNKTIIWFPKSNHVVTSSDSPIQPMEIINLLKRIVLLQKCLHNHLFAIIGHPHLLAVWKRHYDACLSVQLVRIWFYSLWYCISDYS